MPIQFFTRASLRRIDLRRMIILAVVAVVAIAGVVFGALELQKSMLRDEATERASMVADLKVRQIESLLVVNIEESSATLPEVKPGPIINPLTTVQVILESLLLPRSIGVGARWAKR